MGWETLGKTCALSVPQFLQLRMRVTPDELEASPGSNPCETSSLSFTSGDLGGSEVALMGRGSLTQDFWVGTGGQEEPKNEYLLPSVTLKNVSLEKLRMIFFPQSSRFGGCIIQCTNLAHNSKIKSKTRTLPCEGKTACVWAEWSTLSGEALVRGRGLSSRSFFPGGS